jgi:UDP-glucose 4-epimerase
VRDFNFVDDVVDALLQAAANPVADGQIYNLGSDEAISLSDLAALLVEINGGGSYRHIPFPPDRRRIDIGDYQGHYDRIRADLGWEPRVSLRQGLERTIAYYRTYREHYW